MKRKLALLLALLLILALPAAAFADEAWVCSKGHSNDGGNLFCGTCGEQRAEESEDWTCSKGHTNPAANLFCGLCGEKRSGEQSDAVDWRSPYEDEDYELALPLLEAAAKAGDTEAAAALAKCYIYGEGTEYDPDAGFRLAKQAAEAESPLGMFLYARCYNFGTGTERNTKKAANWYTKAVEAGGGWAVVKWGGRYEIDGGVGLGPE